MSEGLVQLHRPKCSSAYLPCLWILFPIKVGLVLGRSLYCYLMHSVSQPGFVFHRCSGEPGGIQGAQANQDKQMKQLVAALSMSPIISKLNYLAGWIVMS